jgi:NAD(P)-dependent dehydrogenase (short-subunit alcohol dehydrogenase family)
MLKDKSAVITGSTSGIGLAIARWRVLAATSGSMALAMPVRSNPCAAASSRNTACA